MSFRTLSSSSARLASSLRRLLLSSSTSSRALHSHSPSPSRYRTPFSRYLSPPRSSLIAPTKNFPTYSLLFNHLISSRSFSCESYEPHPNFSHRNDDEDERRKQDRNVSATEKESDEIGRRREFFKRVYGILTAQVCTTAAISSLEVLNPVVVHSLAGIPYVLDGIIFSYLARFDICLQNLPTKSDCIWSFHLLSESSPWHSMRMNRWIHHGSSSGFNHNSIWLVASIYFLPSIYFLGCQERQGFHLLYIRLSHLCHCSGWLLYDEAIFPNSHGRYRVIDSQWGWSYVVLGWHCV